MADQPSADDEKLTALAAKIQAASQSKPTDQGYNPFVQDRQTTKASKLAFELIAAILVCLFFGWLADRQFGSTPWGAVIGLFVGFTVGVTNAYRAMTGAERAVGWRHKSGKTDRQ
jgi:ATP synthase protein I